jgi:hypothetical protein
MMIGSATRSGDRPADRRAARGEDQRQPRTGVAVADALQNRCRQSDEEGPEPRTVSSDRCGRGCS